MNYFKEITTKKLVLIAVGILVGTATYHFINGFYYGILLELNNHN